MRQRRSAAGEGGLLVLFGALAAVVAAVFAAFPAADSGTVALLNADRRSFLDGTLQAVDRFGPLVLQAAGLLLVGATLLLRRSAAARPAAFALLLGFIHSQAAASVLKTLVRRDRPLERADLAPLLRGIEAVPDVARSFPSGHVTTAAAFAAGCWLAAGAFGFSVRRRAWLCVIPLVMAWDRVALGLHHPSDAFAGIALGCAAVGFAAIGIAFATRSAEGMTVKETISGPPASVAAVPWTRRWLGFFRPSRAAAVVFGLVFVVLTAGLVGSTPVVGRDPATGIVVPGFTQKTPTLASAMFEPFAGPSLLWARLAGLREAAVVSALVLGAVFAALWILRRRRGPGVAGVFLYVVALLPAAWISQFCSGARSPAKFLAAEKGVFVDWHLHGGDEIDGRITESKMAKRQRARGVDFAITTRHDARPAVTEPFARGMFGVEWSGNDYPRSRTAHVLLLGDAAAVDAAIGAPDALEAVRRTKAAGGLAIVAHSWRSRAAIPDMPSDDAFVLAGVDGFEVGNRYLDRDPKFRAAVLDLDRYCRERGLLRTSFSDDHGVPSGSGAVTFLRGADDAKLESSGPSSAKALLASLRGSGSATADAAALERVVPLVFDDLSPDETGLAAAWPVRYVRAMSWPGRSAWLLWVLAAALVARLYGRRAEP